MSRGSTFDILRKDKNPKKVTESQVMSAYEGWRDISGSSLGFSDLPTIAYYETNTYVHKPSLELLTVLVEATFTSSFTSLIEYYNLSYYAEAGKKDRVVISPETARSMLQALRYLLYEDYSERTEAILDNEWIEVLRMNCNTYLSWKFGEDYPDDEDSIWYLKRLKQVLEIFLFINNESDEEITLLYYAWG